MIKMDLKKVKYGIIQRIISKYYSIGSDFGKIFMFHQVNNDRKKWADDHFSITQDGFEDFINLIKQKYTVTSIDDLFSTEKLVTKDKKQYRAYLTFDDIYEDVFYNALPFLKKNSLPFTIFVTTGFIDKEGYISSTMLSNLKDNPLCTIGAHGITHSMVRYLSDEEAKCEIEGSRIELEKRLNTRIKYYAFPYGSMYACSKRDRKIASDGGFNACFSTINNSINRISCHDKYFLPRINVSQDNYRRLV